MKDFSKWVELSTKGETNLWPIFLCCVAGLLIVGMVCFLLMDALEGVFEFVFGVLLAGAFWWRCLALRSQVRRNRPQRPRISHPIPPSSPFRSRKEFGVRNLSCPADVMSTKDELPDAGTYRCTVSDGRDDSALKDVTLIVTADNKVGLYDNQGKEMK